MHFKFVKYQDGTQSYQKYWFDIQALDGHVFEDKFKVCIPETSHERTESPSSTFYVIHLANRSGNEDFLRNELTEVNKFILNLSALLKIAFKIDNFEIYNFQIPNDKDINQSIEHIALLFKDKAFKAIAWLHPSQMTPTGNPDEFGITASELNTSFIGKIENPQILSEWFTFFSPNPNHNNYPAKRIPRIDLDNSIVSFERKLDRNEMLYPLMQLYNEARSTPSLRTSYLLFWQILEYLAENVEENLLLNENELNYIETFLIDQGHDGNVVR